jgi:hypothetical protein
MDAVRLTRVHENMMRSVTDVVPETALQTDFAEIRHTVRLLAVEWRETQGERRKKHDPQSDESVYVSFNVHLSIFNCRL